MSEAETSSTGGRSHAEALLAGLALAAAAVAGGALALVGIGPALIVFVLLVSAGVWWARRRAPRTDAAPGRPVQVPCVLLAGAIAAAAVALALGYLPAVRSLTYAVADLGAPFFLGALAALGLWRRTARLPGAPVAAALAVVAVCIVNAFSFFAYPALVISGSAALQTSAYLLTPGRVFPFYVLAFGLGIPAGLLWSGRTAGKAGWVALVISGALAGLLGHSSYAGPYALAVGLALAAAVVACENQWRHRVPGSLVLRVVTVGAGVVGLAWLAGGDPHLQWAGLRTTLGNVLRRGAPAGRAERAVRTYAGWLVVLADGDVRAEFLDGNLVGFRNPGVEDQTRAVRACALLGLAYAPADGNVDLQEPALDVTRHTLRALAPHREGEGPWALVICDPLPLTASGDPLALVSQEGLERVKARLAPGGVLALWLPAGNMHVDDLRRALATVGAVFQHYDVYLEGSQAVVIAGGDEKVAYARLEELFGAPGPSDRMPVDAGFADPTDLLMGFVGGEEDLAALTAGVRPWSIWRPARPPAMALDLAEPARPASVLALAQYRMLGPERLLERLQFDSPAQKVVALRGFGAIYADRTQRMLSNLGVTSVERRAELLQFLSGPLARLDLLAPQQKEPVARIAAALAGLGLRDAGASVLKAAINSGKDDFELNVELAGILEGQAQAGEALKHLRRALELQPDSVPVRVEMVALLLRIGQQAEAADVLKEIVKLKPDDVPSLLELGYVYAKLKRYGDAAETAERVLRIDPNNADAQALLALSRPATAQPSAPAAAQPTKPTAAQPKPPAAAQPAKPAAAPAQPATPPAR